jgi:hypothetical protein
MLTLLRPRGGLQSKAAASFEQPVPSRPARSQRRAEKASFRRFRATLPRREGVISDRPKSGSDRLRLHR